MKASDNPGHTRVSLSSVSVGYGVYHNQRIILSSASANADSGDLIALIGRNGSGKSTLLRTIAGLQPMLAGTITLNGKEIRTYSRKELAMMIGFNSTEMIKVAGMTVSDLVSIGRYPHTNWLGNLTDTDKEAVDKALSLTSISHFADRNISELSDGERQKAMIARLIAQDTAIMILDEPTAFLDTGSKFEIFRVLKQLSDEKGKTIIFSTHDLQTALNSAARIWLINENGGIDGGAPEDLMRKGDFEHLFDSSDVYFDRETASFSMCISGRGSIYLEEYGEEARWVRKALIREGYTISEEKTNPYIEVHENEVPDYVLVANGKRIIRKSIYDLMKEIRSVSLI